MSQAEGANGPKEKDEITLIAPNGAQLVERYHAKQTVSHVLDTGVKQFGKDGHLDPSQSYVLVYGQTVLEPTATLGDAGIPSGAQLKIRSRAIPGDG